ncbi:MAG: biotin-dependent carboxyltransferase family protein [Blastomonas sp.]
MSIIVTEPGLQTSVQGSPFFGFRDSAMPAAGAADPLALALANRLVGKAAADEALEITLSGASFRSEIAMHVALAGAPCSLEIDGAKHENHRTIPVRAGQTIRIGHAASGCRSYLALSARIAIPAIMGSGSTYMPGGFGGLAGRALQAGDEVQLEPPRESPQPAATPAAMQPLWTNERLLRICAGAEAEAFPDGLEQLCAQRWTISPRSSRMGLKLEGERLSQCAVDALASGPVFPGTLQCPPDGLPYLLGVDGQTSGGYPRIAEVIRADRHLIGQLKPGAYVRFALTTAGRARAILREKYAAWSGWLPDLRL